MEQNKLWDLASEILVELMEKERCGDKSIKNRLEAIHGILKDFNEKQDPPKSKFMEDMKRFVSDTDIRRLPFDDTFIAFAELIDKHKADK